jgi:hypothetical protein
VDPYNSGNPTFGSVKLFFIKCFFQFFDNPSNLFRLVQFHLNLFKFDQTCQIWFKFFATLTFTFTFQQFPNSCNNNNQYHNNHNDPNKHKNHNNLTTITTITTLRNYYNNNTNQSNCKAIISTSTTVSKYPYSNHWNQPWPVLLFIFVLWACMTKIG